MAEDRYSIDDILKEIDNSRDSKIAKPALDDSVKEILGDNDELDSLIGGTGKQKKSNYSVTEVIDSIGKQRELAKSAKQRTEAEVETRIARDISKAADNKRKVHPETRNDELAAKQRTEAEVEKRIARDVANAADMKRWEELSGARRLDSEDDVKPYNPKGSDNTNLFNAENAGFGNSIEPQRINKSNEDRKSVSSHDNSDAFYHEDQIESLNPIVQKTTAPEAQNDNDDTDTLAVSGNDLKALSKGGEQIKEYTPAAVRKRPTENKPAPARQTPFTGELHLGDSIMDALNKKINEQTTDITGISRLNVAAPEFVEDVEENDELEKIKQANELIQKKKRKISEFILDGHDVTEETDKVESQTYSEEESENEETPIDINDEDVIRDRLRRAGKGLIGRLIILGVLFAAAGFLAAINIFKIDIGRLGIIFGYKSSPENYVYAHLTIGILSFSACSSVVSNGFARLFKARPDGDTLCALAHMSTLITMALYLFTNMYPYLQRGFSQFYLVVSLGAMIFNTISKLLTVKTAQNNFDFVFGRDSKYFISRCEGAGSEQLAMGAANGIPAIISVRKTEMLCDFIVSTYCEDSSDRTSRKLTPIVILAAIASGITAYYTCTSKIANNHLSWALTVASSVFAISAAFSSSMTVTLPMFLASKKTQKRGSAILGYAAVEDVCEANAVLANAKMLLPPESIKIVNICGYDTPKTRSEGKINIDEAVIFAASLAVASDSILSDALFHILNYKNEMLKDVSGLVYENGLGVMGWIDRRRILLGTREHMKAHEITVPNTKKEAAANKNNDEVIYLAVGGEVCLLFFVRPMAIPEIKRSVRELAFRKIAIIIKTVDGMVSAPVISKVFGIPSESIKILPFKLHETFDDNTKFVSNGSAAVSSDGTFTSIANTVVTSSKVHDRIKIGNIMQLAGILLGIIIAIIFSILTNEEQLLKFNIFNIFWILLYNAAWSALTIFAPFFRR